MQRWFQEGLITHGRQKGPAIEDVILPSKTLTASERFHVYAEMYYLRLQDCLKEDFPALRALLGHHRFDEVIHEYLHAFPSAHYSLNYLGERLPRHLARQKKISKLAVDVARVEVAMSQVFDEARCPELTLEQLQAFPQDRFDDAKLPTIRALRLLELGHAVNPLITAARGEEPLPAAKRQKSWLAVYRKNLQVVRMDLSRPMFVLLEALSKGKTLAAAIRACRRVYDGPKDALQGQVFRWFGEFRKEGLFSGIRL